MKTGKRWSWRISRKAWQGTIILLLAAGSGCAVDRANIEKNLMSMQHSSHRYEGVAESYRVGCPDTIEIEVPERAEFTGKYDIGPDGNLDLGDYGKLRIEGRTLPEISELVAHETGVPAESVRVRVLEYRNSYVLLFGEITGRQRSIPYRGQETVLDLLQRVGGITVGAEPSDVYVVRPHLGDSQRPEVFHVDLQAIVVKKDHKTNLRILPFDQIYVGETSRAKIEKALPPWIRVMYQAIWDTRPVPDARLTRVMPVSPRWIEGKKGSDSFTEHGVGGGE